MWEEDQSRACRCVVAQAARLVVVILATSDVTKPHKKRHALDQFFVRKGCNDESRVRPRTAIMVAVRSIARQTLLISCCATSNSAENRLGRKHETIRLHALHAIHVCLLLQLKLREATCTPCSAAPRMVHSTPHMAGFEAADTNSMLRAMLGASMISR